MRSRMEWVGLNGANARVAGFREFTELQHDPAYSCPRRRILRLIAQNIAVSIECELEMTLPEQREREIEPGTGQSSVVARCPSK